MHGCVFGLVEEEENLLEGWWMELEQGVCS